MNMEILNILPQQMFKFKCDEKLLSLVNGEILEENWIFEKENCKTENKYLLRKSEYKLFTDWVEQCVDRVRVHLKFQCDRLSITQSWGNKIGNGDYFHIHQHQNSVISGIFYVNKSICGTRFGRTNPYWMRNVNDGDNKMMLSNIDDDSSYLFHYQPCNPGELVLFNSDLKHNVDANHSLNDRYTISFNTFPSGKIGNFEQLAGLTIQVL